MIGFGMRGDRLRDLRETRGITQPELADAIGISEPQVWRYEKGDSDAKGEVVLRIARFFGVSTDYLLGATDYPGVYIGEDLQPKERQAIAAWRRGEKFEAIKVITDDE